MLAGMSDVSVAVRCRPEVRWSGWSVSPSSRASVAWPSASWSLPSVITSRTPFSWLSAASTPTSSCLASSGPWRGCRSISDTSATFCHKPSPVRRSEESSPEVGALSSLTSTEDFLSPSPGFWSFSLSARSYSRSEDKCMNGCFGCKLKRCNVGQWTTIFSFQIKYKYIYFIINKTYANYINLISCFMFALIKMIIDR